MEVQCLGRPFSPGLLYDARRDELIQLSPWSGERLTEGIVTERKRFSDSRMSAGQSIKDKLSVLKLSAEAKVNLLCGLVQVGVSASYVKETRETSNVSSISLIYYAEVESRTLDKPLLNSMEALDHIQFLDDDRATHIVLQTLHGAHVIYQLEISVTDQQKLSTNAVTGSLNTLGYYSASASLEWTLSEAKQNDKDIKVEVFGDLNIGAKPETYEEVIASYKELPSKWTSYLMWYIQKYMP